ncbi:MAG: methyltransferase domain-containing protein [Rhodospirillaceae bacterium]
MTTLQQSKICNVCGSTNVEVVFEAKYLPLTGLYIPLDTEVDPPRFDQALLYCGDCGHGQLRELIDPSTLYDDSYTHRTSGSSIAKHGNDFFFEVLKKITKNRLFDNILEVGCNDLYLLKKMRELTSNRITGVDPIWEGKDHQLPDETKVLGRFVEDIATAADEIGKPDLVVSAHTFEHVQSLYEQLYQLVNMSANNAMFLIEVPSFETMVKTGRFDQVFHQHIQYLSCSSMLKLIDRLGCKYLGHTYNYSYWGGTVLFWFEKDINNSILGRSADFPQIGLKFVRGNYTSFRENLERSRDQIIALEERVYGFGAAQMLPILAYHMETDLSFMDAILDDNPERANTRLPNVAPTIRQPMEEDFADAAVMITALDSTRAIMKRLLELKPRRIVSPLPII